jgi:hypothetical protein
MAALHMSAAAPPTDEEVRGLQHQVNVFTVAAQHARVRLALVDQPGIGLHI